MGEREDSIYSAVATGTRVPGYPGTRYPRYLNFNFGISFLCTVQYQVPGTGKTLYKTKTCEKTKRGERGGLIFFCVCRVRVRISG